MRRFPVLALLLFLQMTAVAQSSKSTPKSADDGATAIVRAGMHAYKEKGAEEALKAWLVGSPVEGSKEALGQANSLRMIESFYGSYQSYDVIASRSLSPTTRLLYVVLNYDNGPLFGKFTLYKAKAGWIITNFDFNTKVDAIVPPNIGTNE